MSEWVRQLSGVRPGVIRGVKINSQMAYRKDMLETLKDAPKLEYVTKADVELYYTHKFKDDLAANGYHKFQDDLAAAEKNGDFTHKGP